MSGTPPTNAIMEVLRKHLDGIPDELASRIALECVTAYSRSAHRWAVTELSYPLVSKETMPQRMRLQYAEARLQDVRRAKSSPRARASLIESGRTIVAMLEEMGDE